jgi:hypothetical protein
MFRKNKLFILFYICLIAAGCNQGSKEAKLKFELISDSVYKPDDNYKQALSLWKNYYEHCMNEQLFPDAFYLQLQDKINIGSINSEHELDINKRINILDTSNSKNFFDLFAIVNSSNCGDTLHLNNQLKKDFYREVVNALNASPEYKSLTAVVDTVQMKIKIGTTFNNALREDSMISLLNRTKDSSLIEFKERLLKPENVLLVQTVDIFAFSAEFPLNMKLSPMQEQQLIKEVSFNINASNDNVRITLLSNILRFQVNKRYSVLGRFLKLKTE